KPLVVVKNYTVKYTAGNNGTITGNLAQTIEEGKTTSEVKATADAGYEFVKWSDGNTSETRTDIADADKEFTAEFVKTLVVVKNYTVKYTAGNNGTITGNLAQTIEEGKTTSEVKATADAGYEFVKWSDGNTSETRTDIADADKEFTAEFVQVVKVVKNGITASKGFSPNGDANNDTWVIQNIDRYPNNTVKVFNRWGKKVYYKKGYQNTWDATATDTGTKLPVGSYIYIINLNEAGIKPVQGMIYINY
ncbi:gliding motility-associated C-terminal domain-containing protein, partial [Tenacibaculum finnmarkense]|uniref:T9SS type B sorting domain-containing protein n=1 Tax=Tenacibaculum finnmarkense TaxID=2781243 RepID=UPI001EFB33F1